MSDMLRYKDAPTNFVSWLVSTVGAIIGIVSDQAADIAARALPLVAPLPNAISVYYVSQSAFGFNESQALAFACAIEIAMFAMIEVSLMIFDGLLKSPDRYHGAFRISIGVTIGVLLLIIAFVAVVEISAQDGHPILAAMTLLSGASAVMLALKRWHLRNEKFAQDNHNSELSLLTSELAEVKAQLSESQDRSTKAEQAERLIERLRNQVQDFQSSLESTRNELIRKSESNSALQSKIDELNNRIVEMRIQLARSDERLNSHKLNSSERQIEQQSNTEKLDKDGAIRLIIEHCETNPFASLEDLRRLTGKGKSTISGYLSEMESAGRIHRNGNGIEILEN